MKYKRLVFIIGMAISFRSGLAAAPVQNSLQPAQPATSGSQHTIQDSPSATIYSGHVLPVNNDAVTSARIIRQIRPLVSKWPADMNQEEFIKKAHPLIMEHVMGQVYNLLLYQYAKRDLDKLDIPEDALKKITEERRKEIINKYGGSEARARAELEQKGTSIDEQLEEYNQQVVISSYQEKHYMPTLTITRTQLLQYYQSHLEDEFTTKPSIQFQLIDINREKFTEPKQATAAAQQALKKIKDGTAFDQVVQEFSQGFRKSQDGLWRPLDPDSVRPLYKPVIQALQKINPNDCTDIIESEDHLFIAKLIEYKKAQVIPFSQAQFQIKKEIGQQRWLNYRTKLTDELLKKSDMGNLEEFIQNITLAAYDQLFNQKVEK